MRLRNIFQSRMSIVENSLTNLHRVHSFIHQRALYRCRRDTDSNLSPEKIKSARLKETSIWIFSAMIVLFGVKKKSDRRKGRATINNENWFDLQLGLTTE